MNKAFADQSNRNLRARVHPPRTTAGRGAAGQGRRGVTLGWVSLLFFCFSIHPALAQPIPEPENFDMNDLETIRTYVEAIPGSQERQVTSLAVIDAPIDLVWQVLIDYDRLGKNISMIRLNQIEFLEDETTNVDLTLDLPWPLKDIYCPLEFTQDQKQLLVKWHNKGGCRGKVRGDIRLQAAAGKTLLKVSLSMKPDNPLPQWLLNWGFKQNLPLEIERVRALVDLRKALWKRAHPVSAQVENPENRSVH